MTAIPDLARIPDPNCVNPLGEGNRALEFIAPTLHTGLVEAGRFTYADMSMDAGDFEATRVLYSYGPERLIIGAFTQIAPGVRFLMTGALHLTGGPSTFPFTIFPGTWQEETLPTYEAHRPAKGNTVIGNDVWLGMDVLVMPGVRIGDGAIVGAGSIVSGHVPAYAIVGGNPARPIRMRYDTEDVARLKDVAWWTWPVEVITAHAPAIMAGHIRELERIADDLPR